jgi:hypothetical protein
VVIKIGFKGQKQREKVKKPLTDKDSPLGLPFLSDW